MLKLKLSGSKDAKPDARMPSDQYYYQYLDIIQKLLSFSDSNQDKSLLEKYIQDFLQSLTSDTKLTALEKAQLLLEVRPQNDNMNIVKLIVLANKMNVFEKLIDLLKIIIDEDKQTANNVVTLLLDFKQITTSHTIVCNYQGYGDLVEKLIDAKFDMAQVLQIAKYSVNNAYFSIPLSNMRYAQSISGELENAVSLSVNSICLLKNRQDQQKFCVIGMDNTAESKITVISTLGHLAKKYYHPETILSVLGNPVPENATFSHYLLDHVSNGSSSRQNTVYLSLLKDLCDEGIAPNTIYKLLCTKDKKD